MKVFVIILEGSSGERVAGLDERCWVCAWLACIASLFPENSSSESNFREELWVASWFKNFSGLLKKQRGVDKNCSGETSVLGDVSNSVWVETLMTSFYTFSPSVSFWSLEMFSERCWFIRCSNKVFFRRSESAWSLSWVENSFKRITWKQKKFVALKKFLSQSSGCFLRTWRAFVRNNRNADIWISPQNIEDFVPWLKQPGDDQKLLRGRYKKSVSKQKNNADKE